MTTKYFSLLVGTGLLFLSIKIPECIKPVGSQQIHYSAQQSDTIWQIYLTIDDGPSPASFYIDSIVAAEKLPVNVFLAGRNLSGNLPYSTNPFIEAGNHSYSHANAHYRDYYKNAGNVLRDFEHNAGVLGLNNQIARLPGRNTWRINGRKHTDLRDANKAADSLAAAGFRVFGWDMEWSCYPGTDTIQTAVSVMRRIEKMVEARTSFHPGDLVILCHETMFTHAGNREELGKLLRMINEQKRYHLQFLGKYSR